MQEPSRTLRVMIVAADPMATRMDHLEEEGGTIKEAMERSQSAVEMNPVHVISTEQFVQEVHAHPPDTRTGLGRFRLRAAGKLSSPREDGASLSWTGSLSLQFQSPRRGMIMETGSYQVQRSSFWLCWSERRGRSRKSWKSKCHPSR
jgi:hypothetical protein